MTGSTDAEVRALIEQSDERDRWLLRVLDAERRGYASGVASQADEYERGYSDGVLSLKRAHHDAHRLAELEAGRWSLRGEPMTRQAFGDPHPDDFLGSKPSTARPWLAGPPVHHHPCNAACRSIKPGFYSARAAADILEQLPGDYAAEVARLRGAA